MDISGRFFDAAVGEADWAETTVELSHYLGGARILLPEGRPGEEQPFSLTSAEFDVGLWSAAGYSAHQMCDPRVNDQFWSFVRGPMNKSRDRREIVSDHVADLTDFLRMIARQTHNLRFRFSLLSRKDDLVSAISVFPLHADADDATLIHKLDAVLPALSQAIALKHRIGRMRLQNEGLRCFFEGLDTAVVTVDKSLRIIWANPEGERVLDLSDGADSTRRTFTFSDDQAQTQLSKAIVALARGRPETETFQAKRPSGLPSFKVSIFPPFDVDAPANGRLGAATVVLDDPMRPNSSASMDALAAQFGLTMAEARVASLVPLFISKRQMAGELGLSENTVKSHMTTIRQKLGARNTTELALVLSRTN
ncbi:MAG: LuxR C-terminal-related transcriptional regulator [Albidovulum sp.]